MYLDETKTVSGNHWIGFKYYLSELV